MTAASLFLSFVKFYDFYDIWFHGELYCLISGNSTCFYFPLDELLKNIETAPTTDKEPSPVSSSLNSSENIPKKADLELLDLYAGCGGMSTGLCLGAKHSSVGLITVACLVLSFYIPGS